jgi:outer membrane lipoprotein, Slp family
MKLAYMSVTVNLLLGGILLTGCASQVPKAIQESAPGNLSVAEVRADVNVFIGRPVRWGGTIVDVENLKTDTLVEVLARPLGRDGRPSDSGPSSGRFLARIKGFLDPAVYVKDHSFTVTGTVAKAVQRPIGEHPYLYPEVAVDSHYLWAPEPEPVYAGYPYWRRWGLYGYDPWYPYWYPYRYPYCW